VLKQEVRSSIEEDTREKYEAKLDNFIQWAQENG
jgi:predicted phosphoadenosine phosphosulfate sulfurtransferase